MILPILVVLGGGLASTSAFRWASSALFGTAVTSEHLHAKKLEREQSLDLNSAKGESSEFVRLEFFEEALPESLKVIAGEHLVTVQEKEALVHAISLVLDGEETSFDFAWLAEVSRRRREDLTLTQQVN